MMKFAVLSAIAAAMSTLVASAAAAPIQGRDDWVPQVLTPHAGDIWHKGQTRTVRWDTSNAPAHITQDPFFILLRSGDSTTPLILASGFDPRAGHVKVTVPWVLEGNYSIVLFGNSGNFSPVFKIEGGLSF